MDRQPILDDRPPCRSLPGGQLLLLTSGQIGCWGFPQMHSNGTQQDGNSGLVLAHLSCTQLRTILGEKRPPSSEVQLGLSPKRSSELSLLAVSLPHRRQRGRGSHGPALSSQLCVVLPPACSLSALETGWSIQDSGRTRVGLYLCGLGSYHPCWGQAFQCGSLQPPCS